MSRFSRVSHPGTFATPRPHSCAVLRAHAPPTLALPVGTGSWPCTQVCLPERGAYQLEWLMHHPSTVNGSIKKEQCAVGLMLQEGFLELYRMNCASLEVFVDPKMVQQAPDKRLENLEEVRESARVSLSRRGCLLRMQLLFVESTLWISFFLNDMLVDSECLILPKEAAVIPFVHMGSPGHVFQSLPSLFSNIAYDRLKFQLPGKHERLMPRSIPQLTWPSFEQGITPPMVSSSNSIYGAYCNFRDFESEVLPHPSNDLILQRINLPLADPRADKTRALLEAILEGFLATVQSQAHCDHAIFCKITIKVITLNLSNRPLAFVFPKRMVLAIAL